MYTGGADLHLHSCRSDGTYEPARLVELAAGAGLEAVSLTDHDTVSGVEEAQQAGKRLGIQVLSGVEISAEFRGHEIHLLGYAFDPRDATLLSALERHRCERERRAERIIARLNALGVPLRLQQVHVVAEGATLGRPHLADALVRAGLVPTLQGAFQRYLNPDCPAFVPRERFSLEAARNLFGAAGGVVVLAHPHLNLSSDNIRRLALEGIDGLETRHPKLKPSQSRKLAELAAERGILGTGGSDCHGPRRGRPRLGTIRIPMAAVERIEKAGREVRQRIIQSEVGTMSGGAP